MANTTTVYKWNNNEASSLDFSFTTRYYDLGDTSLKKNIYKISLSFGVDRDSAVTANDPLMLDVDYRLNVTGAWTTYGRYYAGTAIYYLTTETPVTNVSVEKKLKNVKGIQLRVRGQIPEKFLINVISIEYRQIRIKQVGSPQ